MNWLKWHSRLYLPNKNGSTHKSKVLKVRIKFVENCLFITMKIGYHQYEV